VQLEVIGFKSMIYLSKQLAKLSNLPLIVEAPNQLHGAMMLIKGSEFNTSRHMD
jgi:hypothetical protein